MGREFELKYAATEETLDFLHRRYPHLEPIRMQTTYYDTKDGALGDLHWTLRLRMENDTAVCTLKTPGQGYGSNEWEIHCDSIDLAIPRLVEEGAPKELAELAKGGLIQRCGASFTRLAGPIHWQDSILELALDKGLLLGGGNEMPLAEVEVELKQGSEAAALDFAAGLASELGLKEEPRSKVARAISLTKGA